MLYDGCLTKFWYIAHHKVIIVINMVTFEEIKTLNLALERGWMYKRPGTLKMPSNEVKMTITPRLGKILKNILH